MTAGRVERPLRDSGRMPMMVDGPEASVWQEGVAGKQGAPRRRWHAPLRARVAAPN